jgi:predicted RNA-binding Zn ribbon-like protein
MQIEFEFDEKGWLCLDFANTADWHASRFPEEQLTSYAALVTWGRQAGQLAEPEAGALLQAAACRPEEAAATLARAIELREAIYRIFSAVAADDMPAADDLAFLNAALVEFLPRLRLAVVGGGFVWAWSGPEEALDPMLWPVAWSAARLLTSSELDRVGACDGEGCGWLFWDTSRNRSRRWCDMQTCGNRAKARRHYRRSQSF